MIINEQTFLIGTLIFTILLFIVGIVCYKKIAKLKGINLKASEKIQELENSEVQLEHNLNRYKEQYLVSKTRLEAKFDENEVLNTNVRILENKLEMLSNDLNNYKSLTAQHQEKEKSYSDKINLLEKSEIRLTQQFENIANKIFSEKTASFTQQNKTGIDGLLTPLKEQLSSFSKQVNDVYTTEAKERHALKSEI